MNKHEITCYETDASRLVGKAEKVVFVKSVEEIQNAIKASENVVPRGGGTSLMGGAIPDNSVIVDLSKMNKVLDFDREHNLIDVEAGITLKELNEKLDSINFEFPVQVLNQASTIGGMTAVNASGSRSMKYGRMKNWIEGIEFVNGRGELMRVGKTDLSDVCGMEGITGIIAKIKLKVAPKIKRSISVLQTDSLDEVLSMARRLKSEKEVVMLGFFSRQINKMIGLREKYYLIVEFDSDRGKIKGRGYERILKLRERAHYALLDAGFYGAEDYKFFFDKLKEIILYLEFNEIPYFGFLGQGVVSVFFKDEGKWKREEAIKLIRKAGGKAGAYGIGVKRKNFLEELEKKIIRRVKLRHDPFGKLNKGKIIDFEGKVRSGRHLKPLQEDEIEEIRPVLKGEEKTASEVLQNMEEEKTPEQEMNEFIKKTELVEGKEDVGERVKFKGVADETDELLRDYEFTYESELPEKRRKKVEEFAKDVAWNVVKKSEEKEESEKEKKLSQEEQDMIDE